MDEKEAKVIDAAFIWYRHVLRTRDKLCTSEKILFNALAELELQKKKDLPLVKLYPPIDEEEDFEDRSTTPVPGPLQFQLINKSKDGDE